MQVFFFMIIASKYGHYHFFSPFRIVIPNKILNLHSVKCVSHETETVSV